MSESRVSDRAGTSSANVQRPRGARLPLALRGLLRDLRASDVRAARGPSRARAQVLSKLSILYSDQSVLEHHHLYSSWRADAAAAPH